METKHRVEGNVSPDGVVGPSAHAQTSTDSTGSPGVVSPNGAVSPEVTMDQDVGDDQTKHDNMQTNSITQHHVNMNGDKNNGNVNTTMQDSPVAQSSPELSRIQRVGNIEWFEGLMGKVSNLETLTTI